MIFYSCIALITILLGLLVRRNAEMGQKTNTICCFFAQKQKTVDGIALTGIFLILFLVAAFRDYVGADYQVYVKNAHDYMHGAYVVTEPGYNFLVKAIYILFDSEPYYLIFGLFAFGTPFLFLWSFYHDSDWFFLSFLMFMLTGMYFISFSSVRYYFALGGALIAMHFLLKKKYLLFIVTTLFFALFHKSILLILPVYFLATLPWKRWMLVVLALAASTGLFFGEFYYSLLLKLYPSYQKAYQIQLETGTSIISVLRCVAVIGLCLIFYRQAIRDDAKNRFYLMLNYFALLLYLFGGFIPYLSRVGYYMLVSQLFLVPSVLCKIANGKWQKILSGLVIIACVIYFAMFLLKADSSGIELLPYRSFLMPELELY